MKSPRKSLLLTLRIAAFFILLLILFLLRRSFYGLLAFVLSVFLLLVIYPKTRKTALVALTLILILMAVNSVYNAVKIDVLSFSESAKNKVEKAELLVRRADGFDEKKVLAGLGNNSLNGFYYRFDDHIENAACDGARNHLNRKTIAVDRSHDFEFDSQESLKMRPKRSEFSIRDGIIRLKYHKDDYLESVSELAIKRDDFAEIEIRMKLKHGKNMTLQWSKFLDGSQGGSMSLIAIPDGKFHKYKISVEAGLRRGLGSGERIKKLLFFPTDEPGDEIEIDYIRFVPKRDKYADALFGLSYETQNREMRRVIHARAPLTLKYKIDIPEDNSYLSYGMSVLEEGAPVRFRVVLRFDDGQVELSSTDIDKSNHWRDDKVDLTPWRGRDAEISFVTECSRENIAFWSSPILYSAPEQKFNVIIILEDALRADHMSCYGYSKRTTPVKDEFVKNGVTFLYAFAQATETRTSVPSLMTSLYPTAHGVWDWTETLHENYLTLAEIMRNQGFATASFTQNLNSGPSVGLHRGFSTLFDQEMIGHRADDMYNAVLKYWIRKHLDRNFIIFIHLLDPHSPYNPPKDFKKRLRNTEAMVPSDDKDSESSVEFSKPTDKERKIKAYDREILFNDEYFVKLLRWLRKLNLLSTTMITVLADHGEYHGEHGLDKHQPPGYIQVLRVPLIMVYPEKLPKNKRIFQPVQLVDVMPTILDLAEIDTGELLLQGDSLLPLMNGQNMNYWNKRISVSDDVIYKSKHSFVSEGSIIYKDWHMIVSYRINDPFSRLSRFAERACNMLFRSRVFNYYRDVEEKRYLNNALFDVILTYKTRKHLEALQMKNIQLWGEMVDRTEEESIVDQSDLEKLKALGYIR